MKPAIFEMSPNTRLIRQRLATAAVGDLIGYRELSALISSPVSGETAALQSARNSLLVQERRVFGCIRGEGLKRLNDSEIVAAADGDIDGIRRRAKKAVCKITSVQDFAGMTAKDQLAHTTKTSIFTAVASMSSDKGMKKIGTAVGGRASELPIAETLRAFMGSG